MKRPKIKITAKPLFYYNAPKNLKFLQDTDPPTNPTTTVITLTKTGVFSH